MHLKTIRIKNFRLLEDVQITFEKQATLIVGRNNSGKTSATEFFRRLLEPERTSFRLEDFSISCHAGFCEAWLAKNNGKDDGEIRAMLPYISADLIVDYTGEQSFGTLSDFIVDLNPDCNEALIKIRYELADGKIAALFETLVPVEGEESSVQQTRCLQAVREHLPRLFELRIVAVDPGDPTNSKEVSLSTLRGLLRGGFISAQRSLDDTTTKEKGSLGRVIQSLFKAADTETAIQSDRETTSLLKEAVADVQAQIDKNVNDRLVEIVPALKEFGYPGLRDPGIRTETILDVQRLLSDHTKVCYTGLSGVNLPEAYNGLGSRNLIFILLQLVELFKSYGAEPTRPGICLVFIEEPEAHLHPQMQEVFIEKIVSVAGTLAEKFGFKWPVQYVITTHSSHIANKAPFDSIRYFLSRAGDDGHVSTKVKDLKTNFGSDPSDVKFLHNYMTLTRCDLLFADKIILIEGSSERLLLPAIVEKLEPSGTVNKLSTQYVSVLEVGGAYAHKFFRLLDFLELPSLVITDIDTITTSTRESCWVSEADDTSNACIRQWFEIATGTPAAPADLIAKNDQDKIKGDRRIAYQVPETEGAPCARSFEDAFILTNITLFLNGASAPDDLELFAWNKASGLRKLKTDFALKFALECRDEWTVPRYLAEGLRWLADFGLPNPLPAEAADAALAATNNDTANV